MGSLGAERKLTEIEITPEILKELQQIQLEILVELDRICRKYKLRYSMDGGTLLGAVRHKGFIPWDDDIDIIMPRKDYEKFFRICKKELDKERFFLQEHRTDSYYNVGYPRIRRNSTVYRRAGHEHMNYRGGVFIDLFVLDNVPDSKILRRLHRFSCFCIRKILWSETGKYLAPTPLLRTWYSLISKIPKSFVFGLNDKIAYLCNHHETELIRHNTHPYPNPKVCGYGIPSRLLKQFTELEFEGFKFFAVKEYEEYLTMLYGDYKKLPPKEKRKPSIHLSEFKGVSHN